MTQENQGKLDFDRQEQDQEQSKKAMNTRAILFFAGLLAVIGVVIYITLSSLSFATNEQTGPTMADGKKQEEKLRKERRDDEKRLGQMKDKLLEDPLARKDNEAQKLLKDFERIFEERKRKREEALKEGGSGFGENLKKYGRFDLDTFGNMEKDGSGNESVNQGYREQKEKKSMIVVEDEEKEHNKKDVITGKSNDYENPMERMIASLSRDDIDAPGVLAGAGAANGQAHGGLSKREKSSITLSYNSQFPIVTLYEGECLAGVILNEICSDIQEGPVSVKTSTDFYDESGVYVIIPYGTKILGRSQSINYRGQKRLYIWFERIILPVRKPGERQASIELPVKSIALDQRGINGLVSKVDSHFWLQYGSALLLGVLDGLTGMAQNSVKGGSFSVMVDGTGQGVSRLNDSRLNRYQNIVPTITVKPGTKVKIYIASDIDITAYDLKENRPYAGITRGVKK